MSPAFEGKAIIVTGAASGMGRGVAELLSERGARVAIVDPAAEGLAETERTLREAGAEVIAEPISVTDPEAVARLVAQVRSAWGGIDGLVHCGAILRYAGSLETDLATWREVIDVNLTGTFVIGHAVANSMVEDGRKGAIVNIASVAAVLGLPNLAAYSASKGGVAALSRSMAIELLPHGIRVNYICPGFVESGMTEDILEEEGARERMAQQTATGAICSPRDIAEACAFLLGEESAGYIIGNGLMVDSGVTIR
ncbi:MAG: SDR family oxidoreductase [Dehalococcoidia bacterium]|nr:SDR family oxidoreductase [Dehalococcoidia bacterium]MYA51882.1 SDR family oxidoreductase [Dehalococcoidia bacterium]